MVAFKPTQTRFWESVDVGDHDDCWIWQGSMRGGYGRFTVQAHIWAYDSLVEPVPSGYTLDHLCSNKACVNPAHLEVVTLAENIRRSNGPAGINARKVVCKRGHPLNKHTVRVNRSGARVCRLCERERWQSQAIAPCVRCGGPKPHGRGHRFCSDCTRYVRKSDP